MRRASARSRRRRLCLGVKAVSTEPMADRSDAAVHGVGDLAMGQPLSDELLQSLAIQSASRKVTVAVERFEPVLPQPVGDRRRMEATRLPICSSERSFVEQRDQDFLAHRTNTSSCVGRKR